LGACRTTERRTDANDNDKASRYFGQKSIPIPTEPALARKGGEGRLRMNDDDTDDINSNTLIQKLRQQSIDNKERNDLAIERQTFENNQVRTMFSLLLSYVCFVSQSKMETSFVVQL
jgi:hypothetical protein